MISTPAAKRWSAILDRYEASGQPLQTFARENGLNPNTLTWWRYKLGRTRKPEPATFVELLPSPSPAEPTPLVLELDAYRLRMTLTPNTDLALLRRVLEALC